jgi:hypothetical protein
MKRDDLLYGLEHQEHLEQSIEDVISGVIEDHCEKVGESFEVIAERVPWPVGVRVFKRMGIPSADHLAKRVLGDTLETLDEEHSDPDGDPTEPTQAMRDAALVFAKAIASEYVPWACQPTGDTVSVTREQAKEMLAELGEDA